MGLSQKWRVARLLNFRVGGPVGLLPFDFDFSGTLSFAPPAKGGGVAIDLIPLASVFAPIVSCPHEKNAKLQKEKSPPPHLSQTATKDGAPANSTSKTNAKARQPQITSGLTTAVVSSSRWYSQFWETRIPKAGPSAAGCESYLEGIEPVTEKLSGEGKVFNRQQFVADVQYEHWTRSNYNDNPTLDGKTSRVLVSQEVDLRISPAAAISALMGERLMLHMSDGRKQDFFVTTSQGDCKGTGGPYRS
jgi:hypothetical protein